MNLHLGKALQLGRPVLENLTIETPSGWFVLFILWSRLAFPIERDVRDSLGWLSSWRVL